jgi:protocatechuate 3,4-dioxygenase beta subunit
MRRRAFLQLAGAALLVPIGAGCRGERIEARPRIFADLYDCEGCEGALERDPASLGWSTRIGTGEDPGEPLLLSGTVFHNDGRSPAAGVVIYAHHTNSDGRYANGTQESPWSRRHGRLRGWVRTGADGRYAFRTIRPAPYPSRTDPAHIHLMIVEPGHPPYWIDDVVFEGEYGVDGAYRGERENRGGSGIARLSGAGEGWIARRDIVLELHPG